MSKSRPPELSIPAPKKQQEPIDDISDDQDDLDALFDQINKNQSQANEPKKEAEKKSATDRMREMIKKREQEHKEQEAEIKFLEKYPAFIQLRSALDRSKKEVNSLTDQLQNKNTELNEIKKRSQESSLEGLLFAAVGAGDASSVEHLLALSTNVNATNAEGSTPLLFAVMSGNKVIAKQLIDKKADIYAIDSKGHSILDHLAKLANTEMLEFFIDQMPQLNIIPHLVHAWQICPPDNLYIPTRRTLSSNILRSAVKQRDLVNVMSAVNSYGADINFQDKHNETALHKACYLEHAAFVDFLLSAGARTDIADHKGYKAQDQIYAGEHRDTMIRHFRFYGFLPHVQAGNKEEMKKYLADHPDFLLGQLAGEKQKQLLTAALRLPVSGERIAIIRMLFNPPAEVGKANIIDRGLRLRNLDFSVVSVSSESSTTPLHLTVAHGDREVAKLLIELGANKDDKANGLTPVELARSLGNVVLADYMIAKFAKEKFKRKLPGSLAVSCNLFPNSLVASASTAESPAAQANTMVAEAAETKSASTELKPGR